MAMGPVKSTVAPMSDRAALTHLLQGLVITAQFNCLLKHSSSATAIIERDVIDVLANC